MGRGLRATQMGLKGGSPCMMAVRREGCELSSFCRLRGADKFKTSHDGVKYRRKVQIGRPAESKKYAVIGLAMVISETLPLRMIYCENHVYKY